MPHFSDLPFELQTGVWNLVLPHQGGVHWVEFEGFPHPSHIIKKSLQWAHDLFDDKEPDNRENSVAQWDNHEYRDYCYDLDQSSQFFQYLYAIVPSVYGSSKRLPGEVLTQDVLDEIVATQRCRQLSTYTQVATVLLTCQISRLVALDYLRKMISDVAWPLYRGSGPMYCTDRVP
jgi:hypothetical protein